jgi:hypothetical protein
MGHKPKLPATWDADLAYICGLLTGDGTLPNRISKHPSGRIQKRYEIAFISEKLDFIKEIYQPIFENIFGLKPYITQVIPDGKKPNFRCRIESKEIYLYLTEKLKLSSGKKARIAKVPIMPKELEIYFLAGLLDTDGGKKGSGFGFTTASPYLAEFVTQKFAELSLNFNSCPWTFKGYTYHQIYVPKTKLHNFLSLIPIRNNEKIETIKALLEKQKD